MEAIKFKEAGILYHLHRFIYKENAENTCQYRAHLIICFITYFVFIHASLIRTIFFLFPRYRNSESSAGIGPYFNFLLVSFLGVIIGFHAFEKELFLNDIIVWRSLELSQVITYSFGIMLYGVAIIATLVISAGIAIWLIYQLWRGSSWAASKTFSPMKPLFVTKEGEPATQIGVLYKGAKEKWCKKIKWGEE